MLYRLISSMEVSLLLRILKCLSLTAFPSWNKKNYVRTIFQQDGAPLHIGKKVKLFLQKNFKDLVISRHFDFHWPARSPDITPLDYWFWGHVKNQIYKKKITSLVELKGRITDVSDVCSTIDQEMLARVIDSLPDRLHQLKLNKGHQLTWNCS